MVYSVFPLPLSPSFSPPLHQSTCLSLTLSLCLPWLYGCCVMSILPLPGSSITAFLSCDRSESRGANQPGTGIISLSSFKWISLRDLSHQGKLLTGGSSHGRPVFPVSMFGAFSFCYASSGRAVWSCAGSYKSEIHFGVFLTAAQG